MTQQTLTPSKPSPPAADSFEGLVGRLAETLQQQIWLRTAGNRRAELASVQSTLHELRAAVAVERDLRQLADHHPTT